MIVLLFVFLLLLVVNSIVTDSRKGKCKKHNFSNVVSEESHG